MGWRIERYRESDSERWDAFVAASRNATFLHYRGYMDYHSDRFVDCSWLAYHDNSLAAILPANITADGILHSHQGLTYGGWLLPTAHYDGSDLLAIFEAAIEEWRNIGIKALDYKPLPYIYAQRPSQEDLYALFRLGAVQTECSLSEAALPRGGVSFNTLQRRHLRKSAQLAWQIEETQDPTLFMKMLAKCLRERHNTTPVHTVEEMQLLISRFPENIRIYQLILDGETDPDAGVLVYETTMVAHLQYIATTERGRKQNLLTPVIYHLISEKYAEKPYLDFGISNEEGGRILNEGLLRQKFSYGATGVVYSRMKLEIRR